MEEHRWYRLTLAVTAVFAAPQTSGGSQQKPAVTGTVNGAPTVYVLDISRKNRGQLLATLSGVRKVNAGGTDRLPDPGEEVDSIIERFKNLSDEPYSENLAGEVIPLGRTVEPVTVVDYRQRYYVNSGKSLGSSKLNVELADDGTLTNAEGDVAGSLREVTGAISDLATPVGDILSGVAAIRGAVPEAAIFGEARRKPLGYKLEVRIAEAGYRDDYILLSDSARIGEEISKTTTGVSHTRLYFEGGAPDPEGEKEDGPTIDFRGSVKLPTPEKSDEETPRRDEE